MVLPYANIENTIIERGKRWLEFFDYCHKNHGKRGGSHFREFAKERFGFSQSVASIWVSIGRGEVELIDNINKFSPVNASTLKATKDLFRRQ